MTRLLLLLITVAVAGPVPAGDHPAVHLVRLPAGGIQPQAIADERGVVHVVYFQGTPAAGDLLYARYDGAWSSPMRVNSSPGSAIAAGSVRGARIALGRGGRVHVSWNGSTRVGEEGSKRTPMWYARLTPGAPAFDAQRDVSVFTEHIDGGGSIAADERGGVYVAWHAQGAREGESHRTVYVARSRDDGGTFERAEALKLDTGACGCCGMQALARPGGRIALLYRAATDDVRRDAVWADVSTDDLQVSTERLHAWELRQCPMSTFALASDRDGRVAAAWQTQEQIYVQDLPETATVRRATIAMSGSGVNRKHPSIAINRDGIRLVAWTEGTAWNRGGTVAWELFGKDLKPVAARANAGPVPVWGLVAAAARPDGSFVVIH